MHQPVGKRIQVLRRARLRDSRSARAESRIVRHVDRALGPLCECRKIGVHEVGMELEHTQRIGRITQRDSLDVGKIVRRADGWWRTIEIAGQHTANRGVDRLEVKVDVAGRRIAHQHFGAVEGKHPRAEEGRSGGVELVVSHVVTVRPHRQLRVIVELHARHLKAISVVCARRIRRLGDGDGHEVGRASANRKLRDQPTIRQRVVQHDRVAIVGRSTQAETSEQGIDRRNRRLGRSREFVEHSKMRVDDLHVIAWADIAVCVRRRATAVVVDAFERQARRGNVQTRREGLDHRVAQQAVSLWTATKIAERNFLECAVALRRDHRLAGGKFNQFGSLGKPVRLHRHGLQVRPMSRHLQPLVRRLLGDEQLGEAQDAKKNRHAKEASPFRQPIPAPTRPAALYPS